MQKRRPWVPTNFCTDKNLRLHGTGGTGRIFERLRPRLHQSRPQSPRYPCPAERENEDLWEDAFEFGIILDPRAYDPSGLRQESRALGASTWAFCLRMREMSGIF